ncbi:MAG: hypothetical protein ACFFDI_31170 [Promethearchaeota archaeon]
MSNGAIAGGGAAAAAAALAQAVKASGAIVRVETADFETILKKTDDPLIVFCEGGIFSKKYQYLMGYKGLVFYTKSAMPLNLPRNADVIKSKRIWIPG